MARRVSLQTAARRVEAIGRYGRDPNLNGLLIIGESIMTDVKASRPGKGVPRDRGILASTGRVRVVSRREIALTFGGAAAPYALVQHENLNFAHRLGEARYLVRGLERFRQHGFKAAKRALAAQARELVKLAGKTT